MFYSNNGNYMQDMYSYNQIPNNTYNQYMGNGMNMNTIPVNAGITNPDMMGFQTANNMFAPNNMMNNQNSNMYSTTSNMNTQNPNNLYPSIYRIINPVVNRVVSGTNIPFLTEDVLNNMVDTVYNIVESQVELEEQIENVSRNDNINRGSTTTTTTTQNNPNTRTTTTTDTRNVTNSNSGNQITNTNTNTNTNTVTSNSSRNRDNSLLRDLIKILILRQIFSRNWMSQMPFNYQNQFGYNPNFMQTNF